MEFLCHLQSPGSGTPPELTFDVAKWLVAWADEYGVPVLKTRCEETLVNEGKLGWDTLELATKFRLEELRQSSVFEIANDVFLHRHRLLELLTQPMWEISDDEDDKDVDKPIGEASEKTEEFVAGTEKASEATAAKQDEEEVGQEEDEHTIFMCLILPRVYEALFLEPPKLDELSSCLSVRALWPIVVRALELADGWRDSEEANAAARHAASLEKTILDVLPMNMRLFEDRRVSLPDVLKKCKDSAVSKQQQVHEVIKALERKRIIVKHGSNLFYDAKKRRENPGRNRGESEL